MAVVSDKRFIVWKLTEVLICGLDLRREKGSARHGLLDAHHLVRLVANQACRDAVIALLHGARPCNRNVQHRTLICRVALFLGLVQPIRNRVQLLRLAPSARIL